MTTEHPQRASVDTPPNAQPAGPVGVDVTLDFDLAGDNAAGHPIALPPAYALLEYSIESVLGTGGFGITYLAYDQHLQCRVAIKEYLPGEWATRAAAFAVVPRSAEHAADYRDGLARFLSEARVLASFRHPHIVRVNRFFEASGTAYMVMDYEQGQSLRQWVKTHGAADETQLRRMFAGLLDGLEKVHGVGMVHRDIKPSNIYVRDSDTSLVLLDFGAARQATSKASEGVTSMVSPGFAPFEQYHARGQQGPWSDLYALGGVLYWLVTGHKPVEAPSRIKDDCLPAAADVAAGRYSEAFLRTIDWAMEVDERDRPQSVAAFRPVFLGEQSPPADMRKPRVHEGGRDGDTVRLHERPGVDATPAAASPAAPKGPAWRWPLALVVLALLVALVYTTWGRASKPVSESARTSQPVPPPLAATPAKPKATPPSDSGKSVDKGKHEAPAPTENPRTFACSDLPFALRVTCTIEGKDVIRKCAPDLKTWRNDLPGCQRQQQGTTSPF
ncbi:serine/threonine-protein kinase [Curvibacter sp. APW13]|uniref:serine/threonine-protein kinase n=1 Tax=Curvibacter sp. APW13 TaxID=3077236 RepID=UPI0028DD6B8F|nr:serine/threonine-protein kinase [Curvibacter sp. APW13]MDT8990992.1 serine/threonine-protein kinase [Curvibacter sp. APW13]